MVGWLELSKGTTTKQHGLPVISSDFLSVLPHGNTHLHFCFYVYQFFARHLGKNYPMIISSQIFAIAM